MDDYDLYKRYCPTHHWHSTLTSMKVCYYYLAKFGQFKLYGFVSFDTDISVDIDTIT